LRALLVEIVRAVLNITGSFIQWRPAMQQIDIPLSELSVSALNARKDLDAGQEDSGIFELALSISQQGLLSPLIVRHAGDGQYEVLAGQRRYLACKRIGLDPVPCLIRDDLDDVDAVTLSFMENFHRADMHPLDKARALKALYDRHQSYDRVAKEAACSVSTVRKYCLLLTLPEVLQQRLGTDGGPLGVSALARLAATFPGDDAIEAYDKMSGFNQRIQEEILKRSGGDIGKIDGLVMEAQEGAFDVRRCGGAHGCEIIRDISQGHVTQADFEAMVDHAVQNIDPSEAPNKYLQEAARVFWKALAIG
jgi:ParB/RepB/Spo0J family partition protein